MPRNSDLLGALFSLPLLPFSTEEVGRKESSANLRQPALVLKMPSILTLFLMIGFLPPPLPSSRRKGKEKERRAQPVVGRQAGLTLYLFEAAGQSKLCDANAAPEKEAGVSHLLEGWIGALQGLVLAPGPYV